MRMGFRGNAVLILEFRGRRFIERESKLRSVSRGDSGQSVGAGLDGFMRKQQRDHCTRLGDEENRERNDGKIWQLKTSSKNSPSNTHTLHLAPHVYPTRVRNALGLSFDVSSLCPGKTQLLHLHRQLQNIIDTLALRLRLVYVITPHINAMSLHKNRIRIGVFLHRLFQALPQVFFVGSVLDDGYTQPVIVT